MNRLLRAGAPAMMLACLLKPTALLAADKSSISFVPLNGCFPPCAVQDFKKAKLELKPTNATGANGAIFKLTITGAVGQGIPVNLSGSEVFIYLFFEATGACVKYASPMFDIINGKANISFTAAALTPQGPESAWVLPCGSTGGAVAALCHPNGCFAASGLRLGTDDD